MSVAAIRAAIVGVLEGVPNIGRVHSFQRYAKRTAEMAGHYRSGDQVRGWHVRRRSFTELDPLQGAHGVEVTGWEITGYLSLDDEQATELELDDLVEALRAAFKANETLDETVDMIGANEHGKPVGLQLEDADWVMLAGVLCHRVKCTLWTTRIL